MDNLNDIFLMNYEKFYGLQDPYFSYDTIPCNCGYIIDGKKYYGKATALHHGRNVKMIEYKDNDRFLHIWFRKAYYKYKMAPEETDIDGWYYYNDNREVLESSIISLCDKEHTYSGECFNRDNEKKVYHYSKIVNSNDVDRTDYGKPICKYPKRGIIRCWELNNPEHTKIYHHI